MRPLEWLRPVERQFPFEDLGVRACFGPLPDGSGSVLDPHAATNGVSGELLEPVGQRRILAFDAGNIEQPGRHIPADHERGFGVHERKGARRR